jgi:two-component system chemotaxis response regulator CheY
MVAKRVLSLGQCGPDHASISGLFQRQLGAEVTPARTFDEALAQLRQGGFDLVLVNRVLDYDGEAGLDFIDRLKGDAQLRDVPVMLVSNFKDAQQEAVARGALPGFGKSALRQPETIDRLRTVLGD